MICPNCKKEIAAGSKFCAYCGKKTVGIGRFAVIGGVILAVAAAGAGFWYWQEQKTGNVQVGDAPPARENPSEANPAADVLSKSGDSQRMSHMRQIVSAQEMFYGTYGHYLESADYPREIDRYLPMPVDPDTGQNYGMISNLGFLDKFCFYAKLSDGTYYTATYKGIMPRETEPKTLAQCAGEPEPENQKTAPAETIMSGDIAKNDAVILEDPAILTIRRYYELISRGDLEAAYAMYAADGRPEWSDYQKWYKTAITAVPSGFEKTSQGDYRFEVQYEDRQSGAARYLVVMKVADGKIVPVSSVKISGN